MLCIHLLAAEERDAAAVREILADAVFEPGRDGNLERALRSYDGEDRHLLCARLHGRPVALLGYRLEDAQVVVLHLATHAEYRGRNIARRLVDHVAAEYPTLEVVAETDGDAVGFYRACGFAAESLGEVYPGVERFRCTRGPTATPSYGEEDVEYGVLAPEDLHLIGPLWTRLNRHHCESTLGWKEHFARFEFAVRERMLREGGKRLRIDVARRAGTGEIVGYSIASIDAEGQGELESIFVDQAYRRAQVGRCLAESNLAWLEENGAADVTIVVAVGNERALPFYERLGFIPRTYRLKRRD